MHQIYLWHGCSPVNLLHSFRTPFPRNTSEWLLLKIFSIGNLKFNNQGYHLLHCQTGRHHGQTEETTGGVL